MIAQVPKIGALGIIALCFIGSAGLRLIGAGPAIATEMAAATQREEECLSTSSPLLEAVRERSLRLEVQERAVEERLALLAVAEAEIVAKRIALEEAEKKLAATLALADGAAERDLAQLTAIYENVKPKRAAGIFETMDTSFAAGILGRMSPGTAAEILTLINADKAYAISVLMAARNLNAGGPEVPEN